MQHRKRPLSVLYIGLESRRPMKRVKYDHAGGLNVALTLPVQPEQELGPFWVTSGLCDSVERTQEADCPSLGSWGVHQHQAASLSLSLMMQQTFSGSHAAGDDEETSDTATSSGSDTSESHQHHQQQQRVSLHKSRTAAAGEEDSITSCQPAPPASVAFSFGSRPCLTPDLAAMQCWDVTHGVLAAV